MNCKNIRINLILYSANNNKLTRQENVESTALFSAKHHSDKKNTRARVEKKIFIEECCGNQYHAHGPNNNKNNVKNISLRRKSAYSSYIISCYLCVVSTITR